MTKAKPFIKWVGGKSQLIEQLEALLPNDFVRWENVTYIEPFVGGGAMLFHMLQNYPNIESAVINDINPDLTLCYKVVRDNPQELVYSLNAIQSEYHSIKSEDARKDFFLVQRERFNTKSLDEIENTTLFFFLNRTCFNGLYRVNKSGKFNVPFGKYVTPTICDEDTIFADSKLLQKVEIMTGDFENTFVKIKKMTLPIFASWRLTAAASIWSWIILPAAIWSLPNLFAPERSVVRCFGCWIIPKRPWAPAC